MEFHQDTIPLQVEEDLTEKWSAPYPAYAHLLLHLLLSPEVQKETRQSPLVYLCWSGVGQQLNQVVLPKQQDAFYNLPQDWKDTRHLQSTGCTYINLLTCGVIVMILLLWETNCWRYALVWYWGSNSIVCKDLFLWTSAQSSRETFHMKVWLPRLPPSS